MSSAAAASGSRREAIGTVPAWPWVGEEGEGGGADWMAWHRSAHHPATAATAALVDTVEARLCAWRKRLGAAPALPSPAPPCPPGPACQPALQRSLPAGATGRQLLPRTPGAVPPPPALGPAPGEPPRRPSAAGPAAQAAGWRQQPGGLRGETGLGGCSHHAAAGQPQCTTRHPRQALQPPPSAHLLPRYGCPAQRGGRGVQACELQRLSYCDARGISAGQHACTGWAARQVRGRGGTAGRSEAEAAMAR